MASSFDLTREPWIPCVRSDGTQLELSLTQTLVEAHTLLAIHDGCPLVVATLMRLCLAVLHRVVKGPASLDDWEKVWRSGHFSEAAVNAYLDVWRHRFDLFHSERPFYQSPGMEGLKRSNSATLMMMSEGERVVFDHTTAVDPPSLAPGRPRWLRSRNPTPREGASPTSRNRVKPVAVSYSVARGANLFETLAPTSSTIPATTDPSPVRH
jgi:CRISPR system Cascade subunit CasA